MPGQQVRRLQADHPAQRGGPLPGVTLHLLRVAGVWRRPDEQVPAAQHARPGYPGDSVVVGLALLVPQFEARPADVDPKLVAVGPVRVPVLNRPAKSRDAELALVDHLVVAGRHDVTVEPGRQRLVRDNDRPWPAALGRLCLPDRYAEDMVDVAVRVHRGVQPLAAPPPQLVMHGRGDERAPRVDQHEAVLRAKRRHVRERGHERDAVADLGQAA